MASASVLHQEEAGLNLARNVCTSYDYRSAYHVTFTPPNVGLLEDYVCVENVTECCLQVHVSFNILIISVLHNVFLYLIHMRN